MTLQIQEGKFYRNRKGEKRGPMRRERRGVSFVWYDGFHAYKENGSWTFYFHDLDLIAEWQDTPAPPEQCCYWIVVSVTDIGILGYNAPHRHATEKDAFAEAERLSREEGGKFIVLCAVGEVVNQSRVTIYDFPF